MKELSFETGLVSYCVNGGRELAFNPTDPAFIGRLFCVFNKLDERQEAYRAELAAASGNAAAFELARRMDAEMRSLIDGALGEGLSEDVFGELNVYALADGLPVWANLLLAVMDECESGFVREQKAVNPRIEKYTRKYRK